jgi:uroporphyrinogen decarboxylase
MRQAGRYLPEYRELRNRTEDFLEFCYTPNMVVEATLQPIRRFGFDAAIIFSDILVIPHGLGQGVRFEPGTGPILDAITDGRELAKLDVAHLEAHLASVYEAISETASSLPPQVSLIGFAGAPWTLASYMVEGGSSRDFSAVKGWAYRDPESFGRLIEILIGAVAEHLISQIAAGAEVLQLFDSWAGVLPEEAFQRWCVEPTKAIVARVKAVYPDVPIIGFPNRAGMLYREYAANTGVDAVSIDSTIPLSEAKRLQGLVAVQGNLDPVLLIAGGEAMDTAVRTIIAALRDGPFVFNLGHGVLPQTPPEHVARLVELVRSEA